jgi:hypothetical protein
MKHPVARSRRPPSSSTSRLTFDRCAARGPATFLLLRARSSSSTQTRITLPRESPSTYGRPPIVARPPLTCDPAASRAGGSTSSWA